MSDGARELTAPGPGGVTVIEVRGAEALAKLAALAGGARAAPGDVRLVRLAAPAAGEGARARAGEGRGAAAGAGPGDGGGGGDDGASEALDEALLVGVDAERVELHVHGSRPLVAELLELLGAVPGGERAGAESLEERAEALLADVPTELGARILVDQAAGALRAELDRLSALAPTEREAGLAALERRGRELRWLFAPARIVIAGAANAGKSSLFNLLVGEERAVVSPHAGTTRDAIGASGRLGPYAARWIDTAGEREAGAGPHAEVEREGQALARRVALGADAVVHLARMGAARLDAPPSARSRVPSVALASCADLALAGDPRGWPEGAISTLAAPELTRARVEAALLAALRVPPDPRWRPGEPVPFTPDWRALAARS